MTRHGQIESLAIGAAWANNTQSLWVLLDLRLLQSTAEFEQSDECPSAAHHRERQRGPHTVPGDIRRSSIADVRRSSLKGFARKASAPSRSPSSTTSWSS